MLAKLTVREYMTRNPLVFQSDTDVFGAIKELIAHKITGAPVVGGGGRLLGLFSELDCMKAVANASYFEELPGKVGDMMTTDVRSVDANTSIVELAEVFANSNLRQLPVMEDGKLVGVISRVDILRALVTNW
ncbi:CBS domain-containing protein [Methyloparacoccus murrellii]|jgi:CBS domain-containing protein